MELLAREQRDEEEILLRVMYKNCGDSTVLACLEGNNGRIYVNKRPGITMSALLIGDFLFPASAEEFDEAEAGMLLEEVGEYHDLTQLLVIPQSDAWQHYIEKQPGVKIVKRYSIKKKEVHTFDSVYLTGLIQNLDNEYCLEQITAEIAREVLKEDWSKDFCSNFKDADDFEKRGIGVVIRRKDEIVCGAASYSVYQGGIEVEIATRESERKKGLATICGAKLILLCMERGLQVNWDAANLTSVRIAEKLGFEMEKEYDTYILGEAIKKHSQSEHSQSEHSMSV